MYTLVAKGFLKSTRVMGNMYSGVRTRYTAMCSPIMEGQGPGYTRQGNTIGMDICLQYTV